MRPIRNARGFTVIELLIVIAIISILAGLLLATITTVQKRTKARLAAEDIKGLYIALERYKERYGKYPGSSDTDLIKAPDSDSIKFSNSDNYGITHKLIKRLLKHKMFSAEASQLAGKNDNDLFKDPWGRNYIVLKLRAENTSGDAPSFPSVTYQRSGIYIFSLGGQIPVGSQELNKDASSSDAKKGPYLRKNCVYAKDD